MDAIDAEFAALPPRDLLAGFRQTDTLAKQLGRPARAVLKLRVSDTNDDAPTRA